MAVTLPPGTTREQLLARFHVQGRAGELHSGAQAFLLLWAALPGWRWLALLGRMPVAGWVMERTYRLFKPFAYDACAYRCARSMQYVRVPQKFA